MKAKRGFALIELAIALVIIGLLLGIGTKMIGVLTKKAKYQETKDGLNAAVESIVSFSGQNNRLPLQSEFPAVVRNPKDSWGKPIIYVPSPDLLDLSHGGVCGRKTSNLTVRMCPNAACTSYVDIRNVAFAVVSGGGNYNVQTGNGTVVKVYNFGTPNVDDFSGVYPSYAGIYAGKSDPNRPEPYDDIVKWVTLGELKAQAGCSQNPIKIVNNELPYGSVNSTYNATIFAEGGVPYQSGGKYRWCIEGSLPSGLSTNPSFTPVSNCTALSESSWVQSDTVSISGTPTSSGSYRIEVFVRDNNDPSGGDDNVAEKVFVITINPRTVFIGGNQTSNCNSYTLSVHAVSVPWYEHRMSTSVDGDCVDNDRYSGTYTQEGLTPDAYIVIDDEIWCWGYKIKLQGTAAALDTNGDCQVKIDCLQGNCTHG